MATILLDRHSGTEQPATSQYSIFSDLESILMQKHTLVKMPPHDLTKYDVSVNMSVLNSWSEPSLETWFSQNALHTDLFIGSDIKTIKFLRMHGWRGQILFNALGGLPRGASRLRTVLPYLRQTDKIWCTSRADQQIYKLLIAQDGHQPEALLIPYGIHTDDYAPLPSVEKKRLRQTLSLSESDFIVVYVGRITTEKNVHSTLEAISYVIGSGAKLKFLIVGAIYNSPFRDFNMQVTDLDSKIKQIIEQTKLTDYIQFVPWLKNQRQINEIYNIGDVFVNLTLHHDDAFGHVQVEAMSAGLPVIATGWGGLNDTIIDGQTGFLVDTWLSDYGIRLDMPRAINALKLLMEKPSLRYKLSRLATEHMRKEFSFTIYRQRLLHSIELMLRDTECPDEQPRFTEFGSSFNARFSITNKDTGEMIGVYPTYSSLSDADYTSIIQPYTSQGWLECISGTNLFLSLPGKVKGNFFYSTDLLWPVRIPLTNQEILVMHQLQRYPMLNAEIIDAPYQVICTLIKKGLVGLSRNNLSVSTANLV